MLWLWIDCQPWKFCWTPSWNQFCIPNLSFLGVCMGSWHWCAFMCCVTYAYGFCGACPDYLLWQLFKPHQSLVINLLFADYVVPNMMKTYENKAGLFLWRKYGGKKITWFISQRYLIKLFGFIQLLAEDFLLGKYIFWKFDMCFNYSACDSMTSLEII